MPCMPSRKSRYYILAVPLFFLLSILVYNLPPVHERVAWRVDQFKADIYYTFHPPQKAVFVPQQIDAIVNATLRAYTPTPTTISTITSTPLPGPTNTPEPSPTPTVSPTPLPAKVRLTGVRHEYQKWNNCGPTTLSMGLSFWKWQGDQLDVANVVKPNPRDKNVMPYELADYVNQNTNLKAEVRMGGDLQMIKSFVAAGIPIIVEKGFEGENFSDWMGHYELITGYSDADKSFLVYDSYVGPETDFPISYDEVQENWLAFNYVYLIVFPPEREAQVMQILGPQADPTANFQYAAQKASDDIYRTTGRDLFFAWYNRGTSLTKLQDFTGAAQAYDQAFTIYPTISEKDRPWRMLWYQTGPYFAYYYSGRYQDVVDLATTTIATTSTEPSIEESFYWRAMAKQALGDKEGAISDLRTSLKWHPDFGPSMALLQQLGAEP